MNYFELFEIPVSIKVDKALLSKRYIGLQRKYHPDFYTQSDEHEQAGALEKSSVINKALKVLQNEEATIKYILQLKGLLEEEEKYTLPPAFLMEMMELNENLESAEPGNFKAQVSVYEEGIYAGVKSIIDNYNDATITHKDLLSLKEYYFKKKYLQRILDRISG